MRIAFLSDVHSNFPALAAALASARKRGAEKVLMAGDVVGVGPHPVEVIRFLAGEQVPAIQGNHDRQLLDLTRGEKALRKILKRKRGKKAVLAWTALQLGEPERAFLTGLPASVSFDVGPVRVLMVHGSPKGDTDYIYPSLTRWSLLAKLGELRPDLLVCGHSHIPFCKRLAGVHVVNAGSVGVSVDGDPRGAYALADVENGRVRCRIVRFSYPVDRVQSDMAARGVPS